MGPDQAELSRLFRLATKADLASSLARLDPITLDNAISARISFGEAIARTKCHFKDDKEFLAAVYPKPLTPSGYACWGDSLWFYTSSDTLLRYAKSIPPAPIFDVMAQLRERVCLDSFFAVDNDVRRRAAEAWRDRSFVHPQDDDASVFRRRLRLQQLNASDEVGRRKAIILLREVYRHGETNSSVSATDHREDLEPYDDLIDAVGTPGFDGRPYAQHREDGAFHLWRGIREAASSLRSTTASWLRLEWGCVSERSFGGEVDVRLWRKAETFWINKRQVPASEATESRLADVIMDELFHLAGQRGRNLALDWMDMGYWRLKDSERLLVEHPQRRPPRRI